MNKRITALLSLLLCLCFLAAGVMPVFAEETAETEAAETTEAPEGTEATTPVYGGVLAIRTSEEFLAFAENCRLDSYSRALSVTLQADIDLSGTEFEGIPIFSGSFEGNGHTISGLNLTRSGSEVGLFRYLTDTAVVRDVNVQGSIQPGGSRSGVGGIAGSNAGRIENCSFSGQISGGDYVGGIAGSSAVTGILENCSVEGSVYGNHFVGGIAGENQGVIRGCENLATVNTTARQNSVELSDITMDTLTNSEAVSTVTDVGGIAGSSSGVIRECVNRADVGYRHMGYNIGGIAGSQSGYITGCENHGAVSGRKEVGGIAGQMEPLAMVEFSQDTLQILEEQLSGLGAAVNQTAANAQNASGQIRSHVSSMEKQVRDAADAVDALIPDPENPQLPDGDSIQAAQNTLSGLMPGLSQSLEGIGSAAQNMVGSLSRDLQALQGQISAMGATLSNASETMGGSITDVSDGDTELELTAKVELCKNYGPVLADLNAGGITGAMALENDLDPEDDLQLRGDSSLNFDSRLRCVVLSCENTAAVTVGKQNAGGIVGWQSMGLVKDCRNTGALEAEGADYVGGISGQAAGFIRSCSAKCELSGGANVGGIAGSAETVTDCRSMVRITAGAEKLGAILGTAKSLEGGEEAPVLGNCYLCVGKDPGAVDGISYSGLAEPLTLTDFLKLDGLDEMFRTVTVTFVGEDGTEEAVFVTTGGALAPERIPAVPEKEGAAGVWENLAETDLSAVYFDMTFHSAYTNHSAAIQSDTLDASGRPVLLVEGAFTADAAVSLTAVEEEPTLQKGESLVEAWGISLPEQGKVTGGRLLKPEGENGAQLRLLVRSGGSWEPREFTEDGSYLVFDMESGENALALIRMQKPLWPGITAGAGLILAAALIWLTARKKRAPKQSKGEDDE